MVYTLGPAEVIFERVTEIMTLEVLQFIKIYQFPNPMMIFPEIGLSYTSNSKSGHWMSFPEIWLVP